jgi:hypothetical protein
MRNASTEWLLMLPLLLWACGQEPAASAGTPGGAADTAAAVQPAPALAPLKPEAVQATWAMLSDVRFTARFFEEIQDSLLFPAFGPGVRGLDGSTIVISGYVVTMEPGRYALSANPFSSCFFCGQAGPETVMELDLADPEQLFFTDEFRTFQGILALNDTDVDRLNYLLKAAAPVQGPAQ